MDSSQHQYQQQRDQSIYDDESLTNTIHHRALSEDGGGINPGKIIVGMAVMLAVVAATLALFGLYKIITLLNKYKKTSVSLVQHPALKQADMEQNPDIKIGNEEGDDDMRRSLRQSKKGSGKLRNTGQDVQRIGPNLRLMDEKAKEEYLALDSNRGLLEDNNTQRQIEGRKNERLKVSQPFENQSPSNRSNRAYIENMNLEPQQPPQSSIFEDTKNRKDDFEPKVVNQRQHPFDGMGSPKNSPKSQKNEIKIIKQTKGLNSSGVIFTPDELINGENNDFVEGLEKLDNVSEIKNKETALEMPKLSINNMDNQIQSSNRAADNEFRQPMPLSQRFTVNQMEGSNRQQLNDVSITSEDRTYLANIPINIPPEEHL